jgi:hypothetical protein
MQITYLDGTRLKRALIAGSRRIHSYRDQLNTINVFPVADSDTGTNMAGTMRALVEGIRGTAGLDLAAVSRTAADAALTGAQGNSGTILSQFFYGLAEGIGDHSRVSTASFSRIVRRAVEYTYEALSEPQEGTILTVLRVWAERLVEHSRKTADFAALFSETLGQAKEALRATRSKLPALRKAKVVDAGALGFVHLIEGIVEFIERGRIREIEGLAELDSNETPSIHEAAEELTFRYCTECIIEGSAIDHGDLRLRLAGSGDSLIVAGSPERTKLHVHTDSPEEVFRIAEEYGTLLHQKAEDMRKQYAVAHAAHGDAALVIDSACDLPPEELEKSYVHTVPMKVLFGEKSYIDKVALTSEHYYELLRSRTDQPATTSQPSPGDFARVFSFLTAHYRQVIYLGLSGALSGTIASARSALERIERPERVRIVDSRMATVGSGLAARRIIEAIEAGKDVEEIQKLAEETVERVRLLITIPSLEALLRSGRLSRSKGLLAKLLKLRPLLTLDARGRIVKAAMVRGAAAGRDRLVALLREALPDGAESDFAIGHVDASDTARWFSRQIERYFRPAREIFITDASPALATHTGFGTVAVAYLLPGGS